MSNIPPRPTSGAPKAPSARQQAQRRRHRNRIVALASAVVVVAAIAALIGIKVAGTSHSTPTTTIAPAASTPATPTTADVVSGPAADAVIKAITSVPLSQEVQASKSTSVPAVKQVHGATLATDGKPEVLYIGAEFCPYCAAERWAVVSALSHFGTWTGLQVTSSSATDSPPSVPTLSFRNATYTSRYLSFRGVEETTNQPCQPGTQGCSGNGYGLLDVPTSAEEQLQNTYSSGSIPFVDLGGSFVLVGAQYDPGVLAGQSPSQVAQNLLDPTSADAKQIGASAAALTKVLCKITGNQPASVCSALAG